MFARGSDLPSPESELGGNQKQLAWNKVSVIGLILGGRTIFAGVFPPPFGKDQCVMVKSWKSIHWLWAVAIFHVIHFPYHSSFLDKIAVLQKGFFF